MNAHDDVKKRSDQSLDARLVPAAVQLRFAAQVDRLVARWLERCAANVEAANRLFEADHKATRDVGIGASLISPRCWDQPHDGRWAAGWNGSERGLPRWRRV